MKTTKIFVDSHVFDDGFQGTTTYLKGLYQELVKDKTIHFFFGADNIENLQKIFGSAQNITYLKYKSKNKFYRLIFDIPGLIKSNNIDFAHFQYIVSPIKRCKYIVTIHDVLFIDFPGYFPLLSTIKNKFLYKWSAKVSDIVLTVSEYSKAQIEKHFAVKNVSITTNAVSEEFFETYEKKKIQDEIFQKYRIANYIICISRWEPRKKQDLILQGYINLELYKKYELVFIGDTTFENKKYHDLYENLTSDIKQKIHTFKKVPFTEMLSFLRGSELLIYPSIAEGFGIPPLESVAAKVPTITSNATAMSDFDFLEKYSFDPMNQQDFEEKLLLAFTIEDFELDKMATSLKQKYNWKNAAIAYQEALKHCNINN
jgi:glycosyltransferase involved in cell wall biosynthesis